MAKETIKTKPHETLESMTVPELSKEIREALNWATDKNPVNSATAYQYVREISEIIQAKKP